MRRTTSLLLSQCMDCILRVVFFSCGWRSDSQHFCTIKDPPCLITEAEARRQYILFIIIGQDLNYNKYYTHTCNSAAGMLG